MKVCIKFENDKSKIKFRSVKTMIISNSLGLLLAGLLPDSTTYRQSFPLEKIEELEVFDENPIT